MVQGKRSDNLLQKFWSPNRRPMCLVVTVKSSGLLKREVPAWIRRFRSDRNIPHENVQVLLNDRHPYTTPDQAGAMLESAKDLGERGNRGYGPYCKYTTQFKRSRGNSPQIGKVLDRNGQEKKRRPRKMSKRNVGHVFLGGSCNPTTWRKDVAIPLLEKRGIAYYNPQVAEWTEDLVAVEHNAKESASVLLYVLDRRTRNVVGIVEVANFAGSQREVVLVTDPYKLGEPVAGENISHAEYEELCSGLSTLQDLAARQGIKVHANINDAINSTEMILNNSSPRRKASLKLTNGLTPDEPKKPRELQILNKNDNSRKAGINFADVYLYYLPPSNKTITDLNGISSKVGGADGIKLNLEQFNTSVNDMKLQNGTSEVYELSCQNVSQFDLYIGGSCFDFEWKDSIAVPLLRESRLKFLFAECGSVKSSRASDSEVLAMENSKVLLFVITNKTRGLETMALASYFIGCHKNVVLCIQKLAENTTIGNETLSKIAVNDYNRGRTYLSELASQSGVPVYENISEAVKATISRCNALPATSR